MLTVTGLTKSFDGRTVLDGVSLDIYAGESVALLGANGSGKTTTLRAIVGLVRPDAGRITVGSIDAARDPVAVRRHLSYLPQKPVFPSTLTVRETLEAVAALRRVGRDATDREISACGLAPLADREVSRLSGGERQRLAMAIAFLPDVELYLFDEPSANLDPAAARILLHRARQLRRDGRTLVFTTHISSDVSHLATRTVFLRDGRIERMFEGNAWGYGHEDLDADDRFVVDGGLYRGGAVACAGAAGSR